MKAGYATHSRLTECTKDYIDVLYKAGDGNAGTMSILDSNIKSTNQISKDAFELTINKQIFITSSQR